MRRGLIALAMTGIVGTVLLAAASADAGSTGARAGTPKPKPVLPGQQTWLFSPAEIKALRVNVKTKPWAKIAWAKAKQEADKALGTSPQPADPHGDYRDRGDPTCQSGPPGWYCGLYLPGLNDGRSARALAIAYAVTGDKKYALKSKEILLAWAQRYNPPPPNSMIGHYIAETGGFVLKAFQAYSLVRGAFSPSERSTFVQWAAQFVPRGKDLADSARDEPWVWQAPYGNSATWGRSMAVLSAAVVGGDTLKKTLDWNWAHLTPNGKDYGWRNLMDGSVLSGGKMLEEDTRQSVFYALFTLEPLMLIADVAKHVGYSHNLWTYSDGGKGILDAVANYEPYLRGEPLKKWPAYTEPGRTPSDIASQARAFMEIAANAIPGSKLLQSIVTYGGTATRGTNYDPYIVSFGGIAGGLNVAPKPKAARASKG